MRKGKQKTAALFEARDYQIRLAETVCEILEGSDHAYLEAPTGIGKTATMALIADKSGFDAVIYMAPTLHLVDQAKTTIGALLETGALRRPIDFSFMTWAAYSQRVKHAEHDLLAKPHLALVDECHIGGARNAFNPKVSFPRIRETAGKVVWISATPWDLDEKALGARENFTAYYSYIEAFERGLLNPTELIRVDCSLNIKLQLNADSPSGRSLMSAERASFDVQGLSAENTFEKISAAVEELQARPLRTTDLPTLVKHRYRLMADIYKARHAGQKALFWLPNKEYARQCAALLNELFEDETGEYAVPILGESSGTAEAEDTAKSLARFRDPSDRVTVACAVYKLRAGFDYPELAIGFDCAWNPFNYRNAVQKIGRLIRVDEGKASGKYYYAVDAVCVAAARNREFSKVFLEGLESKYAEEDVSMSAESLADAQELKALIGDNGSAGRSMPVASAFASRFGRVGLSRLPLFEVVAASGSAEGDRINLRDMFQETGAAWAEKFIEQVSTGEVTFQASRDLARLSKYILPSAPGFQSHLREKFLATGAWAPRSAATERALARANRVLDEVEQGKALMRGSPDHKCVSRFSMRACRDYSPEIRQRAIRLGILFDRKEKQSENAFKLESLVSDIEKGVQDRGKGAKEKQFLKLYIVPSTKMYRPDIRERLVRCGYIKAHTKRQERVEALLTVIESGGAVPLRGNNDYNVLVAALNPDRPSFDLETSARIQRVGIKNSKRVRAERIARAEGIIARIEQREYQLAAFGPEYRLLLSLLIPQTLSYNAEFARRLSACGAFNGPLGEALLGAGSKHSSSKPAT